MQRFPYCSDPSFSYQILDFAPTEGCISGQGIHKFENGFFFQCLQLEFSFY